MGNSIKIAEDLRALANKFKSIVEVSELLTSLGSIEQAEREAIVRKDAAYKAAEEAQAKLAALDEDLVLAQGEVSKADEQANELHRSSLDKAAQVVAKAHEDAKEIKFGAESAKAQIQNQTNEAKRELKVVFDQIKSKKDELASIEDQVAETKAKISAFIGG